MFGKPLKMAGGFLLGAVLIAAGFLVQLVCGPVDWEWIAFPFNIILLFVLLAVLAVMFAFKDRVGFFGWAGSSHAAVPAFAWALVMTIGMGLIAQIPEKGWLGSMTTFWPFVLTYVWLTIVVGLAALERIPRLFTTWRVLPSLLLHLGFFITLVSASLGSADKQTVDMTITEGESQTEAVREDGTSVSTGLSIHLNDFIMETYPSGMPKRFASDVVVKGHSGKEVPAVIDVNKPIKVDGWKIYQYDYDSKAGTESRISVLQLVKDPWLPFVYAGIFMILAGAFLMLFTGFNKEDVK